MTNKNYYLGGLVFSVVYILLEITFNIGLVDFINSKNTEISVFDKLETLGRILSSVGFSLFIVKVLNGIVKMSKQITGVLFIVICAVFYFGETIVFNKIVDNLSTEQKFNAYSFGVYRNLSLNSQIASNVTKSEDEDYTLVVNSMIGILANKPEVKDKIQKDIQDFFAFELNVDAASLGDIYDKIQLSKTDFSGKYDDFWKLYVIESRRYENYEGFYKNKYRENFIKTIGVEPSLDKESFIAAIKAKHTATPNLSNIEIIKKNDKLNMTSLRLGDIPANLNKQQWVLFIQNHVQDAVNRSKFAPQNVDNLPHARNIISSVVITPIAIILSLVSVVLNTVLLVMKLSRIAGIIVAAAVIIITSLWSYNPYNLNSILNRIMGLETQFIRVLSPYKSFIHHRFVNDRNPNLFDIVRIEKPKIPSMSDNATELNKKFEALKTENNKTDEKNGDAIKKQSSQIYVDDKKLNNSGYYGELNKKNPYAN